MGQTAAVSCQARYVGFRIKADNLNFNSFADLKRFRWVTDTLPRNICHMKQAIDAAKVNKSSIIGNVFDHALQKLASCKFATSSDLASARDSSRTARRDTTILPRRRSIFKIWNGCGVPINGPRSRTGRISAWLPGKNAVAPKSTVKPPLTLPKITPVTRSCFSNDD